MGFLRALPLLACLLRLGRGSHEPAHTVRSAPLYGNIETYKYYFLELLVGTPPQRVSVALDFGMSFTAFACTRCERCGRHMYPPFDYNLSSSAACLTCNGCKDRCDGGCCHYSRGWSSSTTMGGHWFRDYVRLGDASPPFAAKMGCHSNVGSLWHEQETNGVLGLGPGSRGDSSLLQELVAGGAGSMVFAVCLAEWGGRLVVGGRTASNRGLVKEVRLWTRSGYYHVRLKEVKLAGRSVAGGFGRTTVDIGTTYSYMRSSQYRALRSAIVSYCQAHDGCGATQKGNCWQAPEGVEKFPNLGMVFDESVETAWVPKAYMSRRDNSSRWCLAFHDDGPTADTVLGASWMVHQELIFDFDASTLSVASAECPEFRDRPEHDVMRPATAAHSAAVATVVPLVQGSAVDTTGAPSAVAPAATTQPEAAMQPVQERSARAVPVTVAEPREDEEGSEEEEDDDDDDGYDEEAVLLYSVASLLSFLLFGLCLRRRRQRKLEDSAVPPQTVGSVAELGAAGQDAEGRHNDEERKGLCEEGATS